MFTSIREEPRARSIGNGVGRIHRGSTRRFVFPAKNARAPIERDQHISIEERHVWISRGRFGG